MKKNNSLELFSLEELDSLELLEIKGGRAMFLTDVQVGQVCGNAGCGSQIGCTSQDGCTNTNCPKCSY